MPSQIAIKLTLSSAKAPALVARFSYLNRSAYSEHVRMLLLMALQGGKVDYSQLKGMQHQENKTVNIRFRVVEDKHPELFSYFNRLDKQFRSAEAACLLLFHEDGLKRPLPISNHENAISNANKEDDAEASNLDVGINISSDDLALVHLI